MPVIQLENVSKSYRKEKKRLFQKPQYTPGVTGINCTIQQGEFVFIIGSSGAGKSTFLNLLSGELKADEGRILIDQNDITRTLPHTRHLVARTFGKVCQEQTLARKLTVAENLKLSARIGRRWMETDEGINARVRKVLGLVGMYGVEAKYPLELSGGECRRVELARALINSPSVLVLDELTANLDDDNIWDMFHLLTEINRMGTTVVMATHASQYVNILRRRVITLVDGQIFGDVAKGRYGDIV